MATTEVLVERGDTVSGFAREHGVTIDAIATANSLTDPDFIRAGDTLVIPDPTEAAGPRRHVIAPGDTLSEVAQAYGVAVEALAELNGLADPHRIVSGRTLRIDPESDEPATESAADPTPEAAPESDEPAPEAAPEAEPAPEPAPAPAPAAPDVSSPPPAGVEITYVVREGDTSSGIAARFGITVDELVAANSITDLDRIVAGQTVRIPATTIAPADLALLPERLQQSPGRLALLPVFDRWAGEYGLDAALFKAMTWVESGWQNSVVSDRGAVGIGQLMPATVEHMELLIGADLDPASPADNIRMSARFLAFLLDETDGDVALALSAYHQGLASVRENGPFRSSQNYVAATLALTARF